MLPKETQIETLPRTTAVIMPSATPDYRLTEEQKEHFLDHGFIKLDNCFSLEDQHCRDLMDRMWERLDMDENNKETWNPWRGR